MVNLAVVLLVAALVAHAHVGSPDVFFDGAAGPYRLLITIRPPEVVPGVAEVEIRSATPGVNQIRIVPLRLTGVAANLAPVPDLASPSREDAQFFTGALWLMTTGQWKVRVEAEGDAGRGTLFVPVPALAMRVLGMQKAIAAILLPLGLVLGLGLISIAGAAVREAMLDPGKMPNAAQRRRSRIAMTVTAIVVAAAVWFGNGWWGSEAGAYQRRVYKPLKLNPTLEAGRLILQLDDPGWLTRSTQDLLPDHGHLMHLYVIRIPQMDRVMHLHPERTGPSTFTQNLPSMGAGRYSLYGDVVHANGLAETATGEIEIPAISGQPLTGDDSAGRGFPLAEADFQRKEVWAGAGVSMVWHRAPEPLRARQPHLFRFSLVLPSSGIPAQGMELYMGMLGHAAFVSHDGSVFAHVHPFGSVAMPTLELAQSANPHAGHSLADTGLPSSVSFPYGFPKPGTYRIIVQMKRAGQVVMGMFDVKVES
jgi:hypothetical protein